MNPKISVIVPMYNVEKYVRCAIQSVLDQTFKDFELILIDDCSTDNTLNVAKNFNDPRIKILQNKKNLGAGLTRNVGLDIAKGDYICFFDSDDALIPNGLEILYNAAEKNKVDIVFDNKLFLPVDNEFQNLKNLKINIQERGHGVGRVSSEFKTRIIEEYVNCKSSATRMQIFKRNFLQKSRIKFRDIAIHEDGVFLLELLCATDKIIKINEPFYIYRQRKSSLVHPSSFSDFPKMIISFLTVMQLFEDILIKTLKTVENQNVDYFFVDTVCISITKRVFLWELVPFFQTNSAKCWEIIGREIELKYGKNDLARRFIFAYLMENINRQIFEDRSKRYEERMKLIKENVNKLIPF